ncbi:hypothetical protein B0H19DRAFT_1257838 [Mycena capillaripes]|nr:hypothetical protein B0H19DRAFT_1257838 [Mycena capillaripes]
MSSSRIVFPPNLNRPQHTGKGLRKSRPTPGLQNHTAKKLREGDKGEENSFRERHYNWQEGQSTRCGAPHSHYDSKLTAAAAVPVRLRTPAAQLTPPTIPRPQQPALSTTLQTSSPLASNQVQPSTHPRPPPLLVPQNYQPVYPDFAAHRSSLGSVGSPAPVPQTFRGLPRVSTNLRPMMAEQLQPQEMAEINQALNNMTAGLTTSPNTLYSASNYNNANDSYDMGSGDPDSTDRMGAFGTDDSMSSVGDDHALGHDSWNDPPRGDEGDTDVDEDQAGLHANAQSSLEVEMHDVDVQRKKKRKRSAPQVNQGSDPDPPQSPSAKRARRKKRPHCRQKSRSIKEIDSERRCIVQKAASESGDPGADDDEVQTIVEDAWWDAVEYLELDHDEFSDMTAEESNLIRSRITQVRGNIMIEADRLVPSAYGFVNIQSLNYPTPEKIAEVREANRQLVADLEGTFTFKNPKDTSDLATIGHNVIFQKLLNAAFFAETGVNSRAHYFKGMELLPDQTLGLMMSAIVCGINRWKTGQHKVKGVGFEAEAYRGIYEESLQFIDTWVREFSKDVYPVNLAGKCLGDLLANARKLSDTPTEPEQHRRSMFPTHMFKV